MKPDSYLGNADPAAIEGLYRQYLADPESVDIEWKRFFEGFDFARTDFPVRPGSAHVMPDEFKVINLINAYRNRGHLFTKTNPVRTRRQYLPTLDIENFGLKNEDLGKVFQAGTEIGLGPARLSDILDHLNETYCQSIGAEYVYIRNQEMNSWLRERMESTRNRPVFSLDEKKAILFKLSEAVNFEKFVHKKFPGQKRFSLEGAESVIPALEALIERSSLAETEEFIFGMAHRGRLNVLANIMGKPYSDIFTEFEGKSFEDRFLLGDVKYHLGATSERVTRSGSKVKLTLSPNPSHLEAVIGVVQGIARARLDHLYQGKPNKVIPVLIHGDASIAGQGIVYEVLQMSQLRGYQTGGTVHLVINNQIGFTTNYLDARSSTYCTDVAKVTQSPVFHVNGDDVEAVVHTMALALDFRNTYNRDVFVDLLCYRKYGHNESDEPRFTQPLLYKAIERHPDPHYIYAEKLRSGGEVSQDEIDQNQALILQRMEDSLSSAKLREKSKLTFFLEKTWKDIRKAVPGDFDQSPDTGVPEEILRHLTYRITEIPEGIQLFRKIVKLQEERRQMVFDKGQLDWAMAELLAYGSLINEGKPVRISGQDVERGTFSHRHAVLTQEDNGEPYIPLNNLEIPHVRFEIYNSPLSEYGVLGFEYGYALATPFSLTIWEAQFGDFNNGAQIIIDQFLSSAEDKWNVMNDLVLFLPHGYEGQGPEHSSARLERFLTLCADYNMQVTQPTTPANFFHLLRRQLHRPFRKPLVVLTPKSLLRHPACVSPLGDFTQGGFQEVITDKKVDPNGVAKVLLCTGKVYYDLIEERERRQAWDTAIIRLEQLYPFPKKQLSEAIRMYPHAYKHIWVQEEPANMGSWSFIARQFNDVSIMLVARPESGSPATGSSQLHKQRQEKIIEKAFGGCTCERVNEVCKMLCAPHEWKFVSRELHLTEAAESAEVNKK
ncbi:MAG: 2-oxoglutarate dehydrogenase E1 component [Lentimicrobiaceae bacterium]|nr:2-oxoglutarate dehydrogenase E1 component [Lentimicrobiaceae bacterium]